MVLAIFRWAAAQDQGLGDPGAGVGKREGEGLVGRSRRQGRGFEEALALIGGQVLRASCVDELDVPDQARHFAERSVYRSPSARGHLKVQKLRIRRDRGLQGVRGGPQLASMLTSVVSMRAVVAVMLSRLQWMELTPRLMVANWTTMLLTECAHHHVRSAPQCGASRDPRDFRVRVPLVDDQHRRHVWAARLAAPAPPFRYSAASEPSAVA